MSAYIRTIRSGFNVTSVTKYEECKIAHGFHPRHIENAGTIDDPDDNHQRYGFGKEVPFDILQLCIELDGELYVWKEWTDI